MKNKTRYRIYAVLLIIAICALVALIAFSNPSFGKSLGGKGLGVVAIFLIIAIWKGFSGIGERKDQALLQTKENQPNTSQEEGKSKIIKNKKVNKLPDAEIKRQVRFCPQCGKELPSNAKFCTECGTRINK